MVRSPVKDTLILARRLMVTEQLAARGIRYERVLQVMGEVPRHLFVEEALRSEAYGEHALPIGFGQTISQPYIVARMCELLKLEGTEKILEVGLGSGYHAAVLSKLGRTVFAIERIPKLAERARKTLDSLGMKNVIVKAGDGSTGLRSSAPFDRIAVTAAAGEIPAPLLEQLAEGGRLVMPVGKGEEQRMMLVEKKGGTLLRREVERARFVPLIQGSGRALSEGEKVRGE
ncbi:MAG: protein-L-isoaspartate(D-aspartate) O-methyltransferase [Candidatus Eiseniibacteriota bacterium]|nr:MAG: protein-L-isoaspartate(D-aspartate) O-methyltransferase [Candidatus Eisenbacteria bacterium]